MSEQIIGHDSYRKDIDKELEGWKDYKNDGTVQSMLVESAVRNSELIGRLLSIVERQQETITSLSQRLEAIEEGE